MSADLPTDYCSAEHAPVWLDYWRPRLRLMDLDITLEVYRLVAWRERGKTQYAAGSCAHAPAFGQVRILLLDPRDMPSDIASCCRDVEETIVHELLHLMLPVRDSEGTDHAGELRINRVAQALVRERRARVTAELNFRAACERGEEVVHEHP